MYGTNGHRRSRSVQNYYDVLGVRRNASFQEIQNAYWKKAFRSDRGAGLAQLNEAYETLGSEDQRRDYNAKLGPASPDGESSG